MRHLTITNHEYQTLCQLVENKFGIHLGNKKKALVLNRLQPLVAEQGFNSVSEYYHYLLHDPTGQALITLANRITTNYSFFFREKEHFDFLRNVALPQKKAQSATLHSPDVHLWSAGCSTGEEAYTLAMLLWDCFSPPSPQWHLGLLATDISTQVLHTTHRGVYPDERLHQVPPLLKMQCFQRKKSTTDWEVQPHIKQIVHVSRFNLIKPHFEFKKKFFAIFCRNVMIYFDKPNVEALVRRFYDVTEKGGYLFIGQTESLNKAKCPYRYVAPSIYQKV